MSTAEASTQALVSAQADERTAEQRRRAVSNPFAVEASVGGDVVLVVDGQYRSVIGTLEHHPRGYLVRREGVSLAKADTYQATIEGACYYGLRNLMSRAASRDLGEKSAGAVASATERAVKAEARVSAAEAQNRVLMGIMMGSAFAKADVIAAGEDWLRTTVAAIPEAGGRRRAAQQLLAKVLADNDGEGSGEPEAK